MTRSYIECVPLTDGSGVYNVVLELPGDGADSDWQGGSGTSVNFKCVDEGHARRLSVGSKAAMGAARRRVGR